jgi:hypothetical protein
VIQFYDSLLMTQSTPSWKFSTAWAFLDAVQNLVMHAAACKLLHVFFTTVSFEAIALLA